MWLSWCRMGGRCRCGIGRGWGCGSCTAFFLVSVVRRAWVEADCRKEIGGDWGLRGWSGHFWMCDGCVRNEVLLMLQVS